jgi:hypothetical protein
MPAGDGTGPRGMGPMTGRGAGYCASYDVPGYANPMPGHGFGMGWSRGGVWGGGWGRGRRWRHWSYATGLPGWVRFGYAPAWEAPATPPVTPGQETEFLKTQAEWLKEQLDAITSRIEELEQEA